MALSPLNSLGGFSVGETLTNVVDANANVSAAKLTVSGTSNLGNVSNVAILGGANGYFLKTDGSGNLSFAALPAEVAGSNTQVQFNNAGVFGASANFTFDSSTNVLTVNGNMVANGGYLYLQSGVLAVNGNVAGIFNAGISNITLGLAAPNVTVGSTSGTVTVRGTLSANNISSNGNLTVTNTATITNLRVSDLYSNRIPVSVTTDTVVDSFPTARYRSAKYTMRVNSDGGYQAVEVLLVHDSINSYVTVYGSLSTVGTDIITLSTNISSGNVQLLATTSQANTTVNLLGTYVAD